MAKTATSAQPSMLKSAVTLWMKVTDPESAAMSGFPAVPLALFAVTRLASLGVAHIAQTWESGGRSGLALFEALCRSDCAAATRIAQDGYTTVATATELPLFPALIALLRMIGVPTALGAWLIASAAALGAFLILYRVFERLESGAAATWALSLFALFPLAVFQNAGHGDALLVLLTAGALHVALNGKHVLAGVLLALAVLVDAFALFGLAALITLQVRDRGLPRLFRSRELIGLLLPIVTLAAWAAFLGTRYGEPFAFLQTSTGARPAAERILAAIYESRADQALAATMGLAAVVTAGAVLLVMKRPWLPLLAMALPWAIVLWTFDTGGVGRSAAALWPAFLPLGAALSRRPSLQMPLYAASAVFFGVFVFLYAQRFPLG